MLMAEVCTFLRIPASQRTISLFSDQEKKIKDLSDLIVQSGGKKLVITDVVRQGVDQILEEIRKGLEEGVLSDAKTTKEQS